VFDARDPRATLAPPAAAAGPVSAAEYVRWYESVPPEESGDLVQTWYARGQNFIVSFSSAQAGATLRREAQPDEYILLLPDSASRVEIVMPDERLEVAGHHLVIVPPGQSEVRTSAGGRLIRIFTTRSVDLASICSNAAAYASPHSQVAPFEPWPAPTAGYRTRAYDLDVPDQPGRFGRIWRCSTIMVNWNDPRPGPRDTSRMSPHSHPDFEQCSLVLEGEYVHHLRWPWTTKLADWRPDDHERIGSPSVTIIPPTTIHTSQAIASGENQLIDIFCPPRVDFSLKPGWVLNADEYPMQVNS
jgi:hypothetical protein